MGVPFIAPRHSVDVYRPGEPTTDRFGNVVPGAGQWWPTPVAQWWVHQSQESHGDSILRTVDKLTACFRPEDAPGPDGKIQLPDGTEWAVSGTPEDYNHGFHGFAPGLVVVHCRRVEG